MKNLTDQAFRYSQNDHQYTPVLSKTGSNWPFVHDNKMKKNVLLEHKVTGAESGHVDL